MTNPVSECVLILNQLYCPTNLCNILANFCPPGQLCTASKSKLGYLIQCSIQTTTISPPISPDTFQSMMYSIIVLSSVLALTLCLVGVLHFRGYISCGRPLDPAVGESRHMFQAGRGTYRSYDALDDPAHIWPANSRERFQPINMTTFYTHFGPENAQIPPPSDSFECVSLTETSLGSPEWHPFFPNVSSISNFPAKTKFQWIWQMTNSLCNRKSEPKFCGTIGD